MTATVAQARDEILTTVKTAWEDDVLSQGLVMLWPDVAGDPPENGAWGRTTVIHTGGQQATLANHQGKRRFRRTGVVTVQLFTPVNDGQVLSDGLVAVVKDAFEGVTTASGVIFRDVTPVEMGKHGGWFQVNVQAGFEYDEVR